MSETWLQSFVYVAFRIHKVIDRLYGWPFVTDYYGPPEWKQAVMSEPEAAPAELVEQALTLLGTLAGQGFPAQRALYLEKHVIMMETVCRMLCGESFTFQEEMRRCWDLDLKWIPESEFEQALAIYKSVLPGTGSLSERLHNYEKQFALPTDKKHLLGEITDRLLAEARRRTQAFAPLPEEEKVTLQWHTERNETAYAGYLGNYHSRIAIDPNVAAAYLHRLLDHIICHECYPGHHTETVLKEQELYRKQNFIEEAIVLHVSPRNVLCESIATLAHEIIFEPGELEQWMVAEVYAGLHLDVDASALALLRQAFELSYGLSTNAALLLGEGQSEAEVARYIARYSLAGEDAAANYLKSPKRPIIGYYGLIYDGGKRRMKPWLQGLDKQKQFYRFLSEQFVPSTLENGISSSVHVEQQ